MPWCWWGGGPLTRLRLFGFLCPCHESDDEYSARVACILLESTRVEWFRPIVATNNNSSVELESCPWKRLFISSMMIMWIHSHHNRVCKFIARIRIDWYTRLKIALQLLTTTIHKKKTTILQIPLYDIHNIVLHDTPYHSEVHVVYGDAQYNNNNHLQKFRVRGMPAQDVVEHLQALVHWDQERRADILPTTTIEVEQERLVL